MKVVTIQCHRHIINSHRHQSTLHRQHEQPRKRFLNEFVLSARWVNRETDQSIAIKLVFKIFSSLKSALSLRFPKIIKKYIQYFWFEMKHSIHIYIYIHNRNISYTQFSNILFNRVIIFCFCSLHFLYFHNLVEICPIHSLIN